MGGIFKHTLQIALNTLKHISLENFLCLDPCEASRLHTDGWCLVTQQKKGSPLHTKGSVFHKRKLTIHVRNILLLFIFPYNLLVRFICSGNCCSGFSSSWCQYIRVLADCFSGLSSSWCLYIRVLADCCSGLSSSWCLCIRIPVKRRMTR